MEKLRTMIMNSGVMHPNDEDEDEPDDNRLASNNGPFYLEDLVLIMEWSDKDGDKWVNRARFIGTSNSRVKGMLHVALYEMD
jgi:hypothetical protein